MPGDKTETGFEITIPDNHIQGPAPRINQHTGEPEQFDPKQIFTSPSIKYACNYSTTVSAESETFDIVFQVRQKPDSYRTGQETVSRRDEPDFTIDRLFPNSGLEYYSQNRGVHKVQRILIRTSADTPAISAVDGVRWTRCPKCVDDCLHSTAAARLDLCSACGSAGALEGEWTDCFKCTATSPLATDPSCSCGGHFALMGSWGKCRGCRSVGTRTRRVEEAVACDECDATGEVLAQHRVRCMPCTGRGSIEVTDTATEWCGDCGKSGVVVSYTAVGCANCGGLGVGCANCGGHGNGCGCRFAGHPPPERCSACSGAGSTRRATSRQLCASCAGVGARPKRVTTYSRCCHCNGCGVQ
jgi:hypothetical protein